MSMLIHSPSQTDSAEERSTSFNSHPGLEWSHAPESQSATAPGPPHTSVAQSYCQPRLPPMTSATLDGLFSRAAAHSQQDGDEYDYSNGYDYDYDYDYDYEYESECAKEQGTRESEFQSQSQSQSQTKSQSHNQDQGSYEENDGYYEPEDKTDDSLQRISQITAVGETFHEPEATEAVLSLEIVEQSPANAASDDNQGAAPRPRKFSFQRDAQLLLGRSPSCGSDEKARMRQAIRADQSSRQAQADNGTDDGLFTNQVISKVHAALCEQNGNLLLEDKNSTHGTYVNGTKIQKRVLKDLDRVRLGRDVVRKDIPYMPLEFVVKIQAKAGIDQTEDDNLTIDAQIEAPGSDDLADEDCCMLDDVKLPSGALRDFPGCEQMQLRDELVDHSTEYSARSSAQGFSLEQEKPSENENRNKQIQRVEEFERRAAVTLSSAPVFTSEFSSTLLADDFVQDIQSVQGDACSLKTKTPAAAAKPGKRKRLEEPVVQGAVPPENKRSSLVAAAIAGMVVGSVGTVLTLANL